MFYLIYVSSAKKLMGSEELNNLLNQSIKNNKKLGITGMLLYKDGNFMQMLEGEEKNVLELYKIIKSDDRHKDIYTILSGEIKERNFPNWSMGFNDMEEIKYLPKFEQYIREHLELTTFKNDSQSAYRFIIMFNELNP